MNMPQGTWQVTTNLVGRDGGFSNGQRRGPNLDVALEVNVTVQVQGQRHSTRIWIVSENWIPVIHALGRPGYDPRGDPLVVIFRGLAEEAGRWVDQQLARIEVKDMAAAVQLLTDLELEPLVDGDTALLVPRERRRRARLT
jgi:hypothetical protein